MSRRPRKGRRLVFPVVCALASHVVFPLLQEQQGSVGGRRRKGRGVGPKEARQKQQAREEARRVRKCGYTLCYMWSFYYGEGGGRGEC